MKTTEKPTLQDFHIEVVKHIAPADALNVKNSNTSKNRQRAMDLLDWVGLDDRTTHDYGTMGQGADGNCEFRFTNTGKAPLVLSNVTASCGCTVPEWPKAPILPGQTSSIKVKYNTALVGAFNKSITVNSNAANGAVQLQIKGSVTPKQ